MNDKIKNKVTGYSFVVTPEGLRTAYTYSKIDANGNVISSNIRGSYIDDSDETKSFLSNIEKIILEKIEIEG